MRVASINCFHETPTRAMADAVAGLGAEVLGLQEVDRLAFRTRFVQQAAAVAAAAGRDHTWAWERSERMGPLGVLGATGVGLVVKGGIADRERLELPRLAPPVGERIAPLTGPRKRVAMLARVSPASGPELTVAVAHLAVSRPEAEAQLAAVISALMARPGPHLLLADLNIPVEEAVLGPLTPAATGPTFPRSAPRRCIDVAASAGLAIGASQEVDVGCSDHLAVRAEVSTA